VTYRATWNGELLAESDDVVRIEGNVYFPAEAVNPDYLVDSKSHTVCPWKGLASYYTVRVGDRVNPDAAWYYPHPSPLARRIRNRVAFWRGVRVERVGDDAGDRETAGLGGRLRRLFG
jgi:uncharacterized protein (DUF427 family)